MANIVGVFYVLIAGTLFAIIYGGGGLMIQVYNRARKHKVCELLRLLLSYNKSLMKSSQHFNQFSIPPCS